MDDLRDFLMVQIKQKTISGVGECRPSPKMAADSSQHNSRISDFMGG